MLYEAQKMSIQEELRSKIYRELFQKYLHYNISASAAGLEIKGMSGAAVRTAIHRKNFPVPTMKLMGTRMVRLVDLATFLADPSITFSENVDGEPVKKKSQQKNGGVEKKSRGQRGPGKRRPLPLACQGQGRQQ
jgi:hypothetical protein